MDNAQLVRQRIAAAFTANKLEPKVVADIAFHMTDWEENLSELLRLYEDAERFSNTQIRGIVINFLAHVPNHLAAAKKLVGLGPIEDVFEVGVLEEDL